MIRSLLTLPKRGTFSQDYFEVEVGPRMDPSSPIYLRFRDFGIFERSFNCSRIPVYMGSEVFIYFVGSIMQTLTFAFSLRKSLSVAMFMFSSSNFFIVASSVVPSSSDFCFFFYAVFYVLRFNRYSVDYSSSEELESLFSSGGSKK